MRLSFVFVAMALFAAACSSGDGWLTEGESPSGSDASLEDAARSALLILDDFPSGWTSSPPSEDEYDLDLSGECEILAQDELPGAVASAESDEFAGPDKQQVQSEVSVLRSDDSAQETLRLHDGAMSRCHGELETTLQAVWREVIGDWVEEAGGDPDDLGNVTVDVGGLSFPRLGGSSSAYRFTVDAQASFQSLHLVIDWVLIRQGSMLGVISYYSVGEADMDQEESLARIVADRLERANVGLEGGGFPPEESPTPTAQPTSVRTPTPEWTPSTVTFGRASVDDDPGRGPNDATVTIIEFADFQCPYCARFDAETLPQILENYGDRIRFVYRDFPLTSLHEYALKAAEASECAHDQGAYWEYHDLLFQNQSALDEASLKNYAASLGLDTAAFDQCLDSDSKKSEVQKDYQDGIAAGVQGTPAFFVNGELISGAQPYAVLQSAIEAALAAGDY
jgi:protein-disulfide isomerase